MKAAVLTSYDKHHLSLDLEELETPEVHKNEVLLKVLTAGVSPLDNMISKGELKLFLPYDLPLIAGNEVVGRVEAIGPAVDQFKVGDRVFARLPIDHIGAFAEYVTVDERALALVPDYLSNIEAAAVPLTGLMAIQAFDLMGTKPGKTLFISGGTGALGAMAIPIAKMRGLTVISSGSADREERVVALGADRFINETTQDYQEELEDIDYVLDTLGGDDIEKQMTIMKQGGQIISLRGLPNGEFARRMNLPFLKQVLFDQAGKRLDQKAKEYGVHYHFILVESNGKQLQELAKVLDHHRIIPSIDAVYPFEKLNQALENAQERDSKGKTVIQIAEDTV